MEQTVNSLGKIIKTLRKKQHLTQKMLAEDICAQSVLSRIENDEELPNVLVIHQLCRRLQVTVDQVMLLHAETIHQNTKLFNRLINLYLHQEYKQLLKELQQPELLKKLHLDTDWQMYYYLLGTCKYFLDQNYEEAVEDLKKGLSFTYQRDKLNISAVEIQIISCIGKVYSDAGFFEKAAYYLERSYQNLKNLPKERYTAELAKVYYNYASFLYQQKQLTFALQVAKEGVSLARDKNSFYYLKELYELKNDVYQQLQQTEKANRSLRLANVIKILQETP